MKRHASLVPLSRDHHDGLLLATRLQQRRNALLRLWSHDPFWQADYVVKFFEDHLSPHFEAEEKILFPVSEPFLEEKKELIEKLLQEHEDMRSFVQSFRQPEEKKLECNLEQFGKLLEEHIRCEEREFFPLCEQAIHPEALEDIRLKIEEYRPQGTR